VQAGPAFVFNQSVGSDFVQLFHLARLLEKDPEKLAPGLRIDELYEYLFENEAFIHRTLTLSDPRKWDSEEMERGLYFAEKIITFYVHYYADPSLLPVTYYRKQRRIAAHLDRVLSPILIERLVRRGEAVPHDIFLTEPIFAFKKELRSKAYPKSRKTGRVKLDLIRARFHEKLVMKLVA
jgi:hypothetical protein